MKKIHESFNLTQCEGQLDNAMVTVKNYFISLFDYFTDYSIHLKNEILDTSKKFMDNQNTIGKKLYNELKRLDKEYKETLMSVDKLKVKFHNSARCAESFKLDAEMARMSDIPQEEKEKFYVKANSMMKEAKDAEIQYLNAIQNSNINRISYIEGSKNCLFNFQVMEEELIEFQKAIMKKFYLISKSSFSNCIFETELGNKEVEKINAQNEIQKFITSNVNSNENNNTPPDVLEYQPYQMKLRSKPIEEINLPLEVSFNVILSFQELFTLNSEDKV